MTFCTYRGHAHTLARGVPMDKVLGELMGRDNGLLRGKGGSMHLTSVEHGVMGSYAIVGAHIPIACGAAWRAQYKGDKDISVCFFGDGTTNIGAFHEGLNFAAIWKLPVVFVCENNLYMEYTPIGEVTAVPDPAAGRASAYGLESIVIDGQDADVVYRTARTAYDKARAGGGPSLIECRTYRYSGHSRADPAKYRPEGELDFWRGERDPVRIYRERLLKRGIDEAILIEIEDVSAAEWMRLPRSAKPRRRLRRSCCDRRLCGWRLGVAELSYRDAVARGIAQEMERDPDVVFLGEDVAQGRRRIQSHRRPLRKVRAAARARYADLGTGHHGRGHGRGDDRIEADRRDHVLGFHRGLFRLSGQSDSKSRYMTNGQVKCPLVVRTANGGGLRFGAQHSQSVENWCMMIPGLKVVAPSTPRGCGRVARGIGARSRSGHFLRTQVALCD